jgi:hypothetical protein
MRTVFAADVEIALLCNCQGLVGRAADFRTQAKTDQKRDEQFASH